MTKYRPSTDPDTGKPCMVSDPNGIYYSTGEVNREIDKLATAAGELGKRLVEEVKAREQRDDLIRRMAGMMKRARPEFLKIAGPYADPFDPKYLLGCVFCVTAEHSNEKIPTTLEHEDDCPWFEIIKEAEAYAAGTHDAGAVSEGDGAGAGDSCHRDEESASE